MKKVWIVADSIISPLGVTTQENYENVRNGISGLSLIENSNFYDASFYGGQVQHVSDDASCSKFESLCSAALERLLKKVTINRDRSLFILSTTKGNIGYLEEGRADHPRLQLHEVAEYLATTFGFKNKMVVSNACVSGVMALLIGKRMIEAGKYEHAVVLGADVLNRFVVSGFQSLQALSPEICRPFDNQRKGINLGECAAGVVLSANAEAGSKKSSVFVAGGGLSNDANHISGPSRTGEELGFAIRQAVKEAGIAIIDIDFVSAHGTATLYNDEMEAKAFSLTQLDNIPLNSLKGYYGHTLGAAGVLETILSTESLKHDELIPTAGFQTLGVSKSVNVIKKLEPRPLKTCLKTASGFGGCNAAIILQKET
jgi:3-oxoacyl-[acyl-carrier-protein] synthase I